MAGGIVTLFQLAAFRNAYALRGALVWLVIRVALANPQAQIVHPEPLTELGILGVVALAVFMDARRRSEDLVLGNLGIASWTVAFMALPIALMLEVLVP